MKWPKQEHHQCEDVERHIKNPHEKPMSIISTVGMKNQEIEWNCVVSELD